MSLSLDLGTKPDGLTACFMFGEDVICLGAYEITMRDFLGLAEYVLTNTDLTPNDPRLHFVRLASSMCVVDGYNPGHSRLKVNTDHVALLPDARVAEPA